MSIYGTKSLSEYGRWDKDSNKRKMFLEATTGGVHSADLANYYPKSQDWRKYLIKPSAEERNEIILSLLDPAVLDYAPKDTAQALKKIGLYIPNVSAKFLEEYIEKQNRIIDTLESGKFTEGAEFKWEWKHMPIGAFCMDILSAERKKLKDVGVPALFYKEQRLMLTRLTGECGREGHSSKCIIFQGTVYSPHPVALGGVAPRVGQLKLNDLADRADFNRIQEKVMGRVLVRMNELGNKTVDEKVAYLTNFNFEDPALYLVEENQELFGLTDEEIQFVEDFLERYEIEINAKGQTRVRLEKPSEWV